MNFGFQARIGTMASLLLAVWGCSDMAPADDTYTKVYGAQPGGSGGGDDPSGTGGNSGMAPDPVSWGCLGSAMPAPTLAPTRITYQVVIVDFDSQPLVPMPVPNLTVEVCTTSTCDRLLPVCSSTTPAPTEQCARVAVGARPFLYLIDLPYALNNGGLKLTATGYAQMNYIFGGPMVGTPEGEATVVGLTIPLLTIDARSRAYGQVQVPTVDPARGTLAVRTLNCLREPTTPPAMPAPPQGQRATGVRVEAVPEQPPEPAVAWRLSNGNQFSRNTLLTDARGVAGFLNAAPGSIEVKAVLSDDTDYAGTVLPILPDVITLAELRPGLEVWGQ
jgi:hypothetical protein